MMNCYLLDGEFQSNGIEFENFDEIEAALGKNQNLLYCMPVQAVIMLLDEWSKAISKDKSILKREGTAYLSFFLRKNNIEKLIVNSLGDKKYLDEFVDIGQGKFIKAQGRGVVCHWIAGNIKTLAFFSLIQSILGGNSNLLRVPKDNIHEVLDIISLFSTIKVEYQNKWYHSMDIIKNISLVCFDSGAYGLNKRMSLLADARVIWGGEEAVNSINALPKKTTCRDVVFGPKYSLAVMDKTIANLEQSQLQNYINAFAQDVAQFDQDACSSPHVLFIEGTFEKAKEIAEVLAKAFEKINKRYSNIVGEAKASKIINERGRYGLSLDKECYASRDLSYTILIDSELSLKEPVSGRCVYIKSVGDIFQIEKLITKKVQTVGFGSLDNDRTIKFANKLSRRGVDRIARLGSMNIYDYPWDGTFLLNELVRWCSLNL